MNLLNKKTIFILLFYKLNKNKFKKSLRLIIFVVVMGLTLEYDGWFILVF